MFLHKQGQDIFIIKLNTIYIKTAFQTNLLFLHLCLALCQFSAVLVGVHWMLVWKNYLNPTKTWLVWGFSSYSQGKQHYGNLKYIIHIYKSTKELLGKFKRVIPCQIIRFFKLSSQFILVPSIFYHILPIYWNVKIWGLYHNSLLIYDDFSAGLFCPKIGSKFLQGHISDIIDIIS